MNPPLLYLVAHETDRPLVLELEKQLAPLQGLVRLFAEHHIPPGTNVQAAIDRHLAEARIVLPVVSANLLASDRHMEQVRRAPAQATVVPILLRACLWQLGPLAGLSPLPADQRPVTAWTDRQAAWLDVVQGILSLLGHGRTQAPAPGPTPRTQAGPEILFAWVHLSDLHFGHGDAAHGWDQQLVLQVLLRDIAERLRKGCPAPDAALITGDIAFSGDTRPPGGEYDRARQFLASLAQATGLSAGQIFPIPGNHDVQRPVDQDRAVARLLRDLRDGREPLDTALADAGDRGRLAQRQAHYLAFAADHAPACLGPAAPPEQRLWWVHRLEARGGLRVRLVGLNTALLAADDQDPGRLRLGKAALAQALASPPPGPGELVVVLSHHPFRGGWLERSEERECDAWVRNHAHLHLSGHVHEADSEGARSGAGGDFLRVSAGAAHGERLPPGVPASHGYNFAAVLRLPDGSLQLRLWPRRWSDRSKTFVADSDNVPEGQLHADHPLRLRL
jgi:hypothetical protein